MRVPSWMLILLLPLLTGGVRGSPDTPAGDGGAEPGRADSPRPQDLEARISKAVQAGGKVLHIRLEAILANPPGDYPVGRIAFPVAALLKSGTSADDPVIEAALRKLSSLKVEKTYCAACYLFALDALSRRRAAAAKEALDVKDAAGARGADPPRTPQPRLSGLDSAERKKVEDLVNWLVDGRLKGHGSWTYEQASKKSHHDFSNTQFAVLGLQIGLEHGVAVPPEVFLEVSSLFTGAMTRAGEPEEVSYTLEAPLEAKLGLTRVSYGRRTRAAPGGWGYTDPRRGRGERDEPYASMTAAGASSLIIALKALDAAEKRRVPVKKAAPDSEKALESAYGWIAKHFDEYVADGRQLYYTLYSLEKAGDLGGIEKFGERDWYAEGAERILEKERPKGGWGTYVDTSLALLFLTRATRLLETAASPRIVTGSDGGGPRASGDMVYIDRAKGFLSARALLEYMGETRRPELVVVGEEVVRHYAPDAKAELVEHLLRLWSKPDRITAFARKALTEITGEAARDRAVFVEWQKGLEAVRALEADLKLTPEALGDLLRGLPGPHLRSRLVDLAHRRSLRSLAGLLVQEMAVPSIEYRRKLHGILSLWTGAPLPSPGADTEAAWQSAAEAWQAWWAANGR